MDNDSAMRAFERHMEMRDLSRATKENRRSQLRALARFLGDDVPMLAATRDDLLDYAAAIAHYLPRTRYARISSAHSFYTWAHDEGIIATVPTHRVPRPKLPRAMPRPITEARLAVAIATAPDEVRPWLVLAAFAGLRCCEISRLTRDQYLDTADPPMLVVHGKGGKDRIVPLNRWVVNELDRCNLPSRGHLWNRRDGKPGPPSPNRVSQIMNRWLHSLDIPETAHQLRHRFASQVQRNIGDIQVTATLLGHSNLTTTLIYAQFSDDRALAAVRSLDQPPRPVAVA